MGIVESVTLSVAKTQSHSVLHPSEQGQKKENSGQTTLEGYRGQISICNQKRNLCATGDMTLYSN